MITAGSVLTMANSELASICITALHAHDLSRCKPLGLDAGTWIAIITAVVGAALFVLRYVLKRLRHSPGHSSRLSGTLWMSRFRNLCHKIKPLMDVNYRIFYNFGPNGGVGDGSPKVVRYDLGVWREARKEIVHNNARIRELIESNFDAIPRRFQPTFSAWLNHISAFHAHVLDPEVDYRDHQFPREASIVVSRYG